MPPQTPFIVSGTITGDDAAASSGAIILITSPSEGTSSIVAESNGQYVIDLANVGYTDGETATYVITDKFLNERVTGSFTITGGSKTLDATTVVITDPLPVPGARHVMLVGIGGKPISRDNPLPVKTV